MSPTLRYAARSDRGLVRQNNEDSAYAGPRLLALADGMGGHAAGEVASQIAIAALAQLDEDQPGSDLTGSLHAVMDEANDLIASHIEAHPETDGMGCTLTALLFDGRRVGMIHVGDSRAYLLRDGELTQITRDDTYVQSLVDEGKLSADEAHSHPRRSLILKALTGEPVEPTLVTREARVGDRYLLCSDGLSDPVSTDTIAETLRSDAADTAADRLVSLALRSGGPDNVTVVVADLVSEGPGGFTEPVVVGAASTDEQADSASGADTAAGRAAAFSRSQEASRARPERIAAGSAATPTEDDDAAEGDAPRRRTGLRFGLSVLGVLLLLVVGGVVSAILVRSNYFVAAADSQVVVKRGIAGDVFGVELASVYRVACLSDDGSLGLHDADSIPPGCNVLTLGDLREPAREGVRAGLPSGSLDDASAQITRLAEENLLPECPPAGATPPAKPGETKAPETKAPETKPGETKPPETKPGESKAPETTPAPTPVPGRDCRAVK